MNKRTLQMETVKFLQNIGSSRDCDVWTAQLSQHVNGITFRESRNPFNAMSAPLEKDGK